MVYFLLGAVLAVVAIHLTERRRLRRVSARALARLERDYKAKRRTL